MTTSEALAFFKTNGYLVIPNALTPDEVAFLNAFVDRDLAAQPDDWHVGKTSVRSHGHPLMENPRLDPYVWCLIPESRALHPDPGQRAFYSHWSAAMRNAARWFMPRQ